jgi:glycosyltransferase involved in cell wall biosynthesis
LVPYDNTAAFVEAAANLARDWPQGKTMGANARFVAEQLGWERLVEELEAVFHQAAQTLPASQAILMAHPQNASA